MRTLYAIDAGGTRRVGLALSDEGGRFATPLDVLTIASPQQAIDEILLIIRKEGVERLVVGLPLNMDTRSARQHACVMTWARALAQPQENRW